MVSAVVVSVPRSSKIEENTVLRSSKQATRFLKHTKTENLPKFLKARFACPSSNGVPSKKSLCSNVAISCIISHRDWHGDVRYIQIGRDAVGTLWLYVVTDDSRKEMLPTTGESVGVDFGMETYLTLHTGEKIQHPQPLKHSLSELRKLNKAVSRKVKGSHNWWRAVRDLARLYRKVANQRRDWHWKLATDLCRRFDAIATETLNLDAMKRLWGRKVSDLAFGEFVKILKFKCLKHNREFHQVGQWTPTSKPCSECGYHNENLSLSDRQWTCPECGSHHDRDINAAINILRGCLGPPVEQM